MPKATILKPCPFCGNEDIRLCRYDPYDGYIAGAAYYRVRCAQCNCVIHRDNFDEAAKAWNTRIVFVEVPECP